MSGSKTSTIDMLRQFCPNNYPPSPEDLQRAAKLKPKKKKDTQNPILVVSNEFLLPIAQDAIFLGTAIHKEKLQFTNTGPIVACFKEEDNNVVWSL